MLTLTIEQARWVDKVPSNHLSSQPPPSVLAFTRKGRIFLMNRTGLQHHIVYKRLITILSKSYPHAVLEVSEAGRQVWWWGTG